MYKKQVLSSATGDDVLLFHKLPIHSTHFCQWWMAWSMLLH